MGSEAQQQERVLGHDEYDPIGTLALIGLYFLILVAMWLFMYFVEFVGNGPTVVGTVVGLPVGTVVGLP